MRSTMTVHHGDVNKILSFEAPMRLSDILQQNGFPFDQPCGGRGKCGKCRLRARGALRPAEDRERDILTPEELAQGVRLACLAVAEGDGEIWLTSGAQEQILTGFRLPHLDGAPWSEGLGLAVDVGTTTLAAYLYDLASGAAIGIDSRPNPQRRFGADVTSRLKASMDARTFGRKALQETIAGALTASAQALLARAGRSPDELKCAVVTGNTAMLYLLTGQTVESIAFAPFMPSTRFGTFISSTEIGLPSQARVWLPECVAAYIGADITCAMLYAGFLPDGSVRRGAPVLMADIGTNGEMALSAGGRILTCSTAAGPAFEGAGIRCGMTARDGAIHRVELTEAGIEWSVIGDMPAQGICGSGLVDAMAALLEAEAIDETGRLHLSGHPLASCMIQVDGQPAFQFPETGVVITQADVRAVQLAKAAICAGMQVLMDAAGVDAEDVAELQIAGGFGNCIRPASAERIGLIPEGFARRTRAIGNAAGAGAAMMLLSDAHRRRGAALSAACQVVELSANPSFNDHYIDCMAFE